MARPTKQGLSYFPIDTNFDDKTELFVIENGADGLGILLTVWQLIYDNEGYYIKNGNDLNLLVKKRVFSDINRVKEVINGAIKRGLFDEKLHNKYNILTSKAIQKRYFEASKKKKIVKFNINYIINGVNVSGNSVNVGENATNVKEEVNVKEEIKAKESKFKDDVNSYSNEYDPKLLDSFFAYWSEPNKSRTKMRWELERTWDLKRRLKTWENNNLKWNKDTKADLITYEELLQLNIKDRKVFHKYEQVEANGKKLWKLKADTA